MKKLILKYVPLPVQTPVRRWGVVEVALSDGPRVGARRKLSGREGTLLVAVACSDPPAGRARWTLELLADEMVPWCASEHPPR